MPKVSVLVAIKNYLENDQHCKGTKTMVSEMAEFIRTFKVGDREQFTAEMQRYGFDIE